jgi:hypothetical protein
MGIFIADSDMFDLSFYVGDVDGYTTCFETEDEAKIKAKEYEKHVISFKKISYGVQKKIQMAAMTESDGRFVFNPIKFRSERFSSSVKKWTFKDSAGNAVPVNNQTIDNLSEGVASFLLELFDRRLT